MIHPPCWWQRKLGNCPCASEASGSAKILWNPEGLWWGVCVSLPVHVCVLNRDLPMASRLQMDLGSFPAYGSKLRFSVAQRQRGEPRIPTVSPKNLYSPIKPQGVWTILLALITFCLGSWGRWAWRAFVFKNLTCLPGEFPKLSFYCGFQQGILFQGIWSK